MKKLRSAAEAKGDLYWQSYTTEMYCEKVPTSLGIYTTKKSIASSTIELWLTAFTMDLSSHGITTHQKTTEGKLERIGSFGEKILWY